MSKITLTHSEVKSYENLLLNENFLFELSVVPQMIVNKNRIIIRVNKKFAELFGYKADDILGKQTLVLTPSKEKFDAYRKYFTQTKDGIFKSEELQYKKSDQTLFWTRLEGIEIHNRDDELFILWSFIDIDKEVKYREELKLLASLDPLTGLYNRRFFTGVSQTILKIAKREYFGPSVIMLDIDKFKKINDTYGHDIGDEVIVILSEILKKHTRGSDIVCRFGGEEFIILLPKTTKESAINIAEKLRSTIEHKKVLLKDKNILKFTASFGVSQVDIDNEERLEPAIKRADNALYSAKESGRNLVVS